MGARDDLVRVWRGAAEVIQPPDRIAAANRAAAVVGNDGKLKAAAVAKAAPSQMGSWYVAGTLGVATAGWRWMAPSLVTVERVMAVVGTAPTGAAVVLKFKAGGSLIATLTIEAGATTGYVAVGTKLDAGTVVSMEISQVGSTINGANLSAHLVFKPEAGA